MSAFVVSSISPSLKIDSDQRFIFGLVGSPEPFASVKYDNTYTPILGSSSFTYFQMRNQALSGYRWVHETQFGQTYGSFKLQKFLNASAVGVDIMSFNDDGSFLVPGITLTSKYIIQQPDASLPNAQSLSSLQTGLVKNTTSTGILSIAVPGVDYLPMSGGTLTGDLILNGDPTNPLGAVTRQYADSISQGLTFKNACYAATTSNLTANYVGVTLTNSGSLVTFSVDGVEPPLNSRILVKNQTTQLQNGIYTLTNVGSSSVPWILTRATDYDQTSEIRAGDFILVDNGTLNSKTAWVQTATINTFGSDPILFSQFGMQGTVTNVSGTSGQIIVANGTSTPVISIDPTYLSSTAPNSANYIIQTSDSSLSNAQVLGNLATGILKNTTTTGVVSIAIAGTDYYSPNNPTIIKDTDTVNFNVSLGIQAAASLTTADSTTAMGYKTLNLLTTGTSNTGFGSEVLKSVQTGQLNTGVGSKALFSCTGSSNVAVGAFSLINANSVNYNVGIGSSSFGLLTLGSQNVAVGSSTGTNQTVYNDCVFLGYRADASSNNLNNAVAIGANSSVGASDSMALGNNLMKVGIRNSTPQYPLDVNGIVNVNNNRIINGADPIDPQDFVTKNHYDTSTIINNTKTVSGTTQTFNYSSALSSSILEILNNNPSAVTYFKAGTSVDNVQIGFDGLNGYSFINLVSSSNDRLAFRVNGVGVGALIQSGLFGLGTITPTLAKIEVVGGVQNLVNEDSCIRVKSPSNSAKIELQCTAAGGSLWELRSNSNGSFDLVNRTLSVATFTVDSNRNHIFNTVGTIYGKRPCGNIYMSDNTTATSVVANTWVKANGITTLGTTTNGFTSPTSNRLTWTGPYSLTNIDIIASITFTYGTVISSRIGISLFKNGTLITGSPKYVQSTGSGISVFVSCQASVSMLTNDYIEIYVRTPGTSSFVVTDLTLSMQS